jgi:hypothetical protein
MTGRRAGVCLLVALAAFAWAAGFEQHMLVALTGPMIAALGLIVFAPAKKEPTKGDDNTKGAQ